MVKAKKFVYAKPFVGEPNSSNFRLEEEELGPLKDGNILCEAVCLSVDPYMRPYMVQYPVNSTMIGGQIAKIIESKNDKFPVGSHVMAYFGWRSHTLVENPTNSPKAGMDPNNVFLLPDFGNLPLSLGLGCLGMPGYDLSFIN